MDLWLFAVMLVIVRVRLWLALVVIVSGLVTPSRYRWIWLSIVLIIVGVWVFSSEPLDFGPHIAVANWITILVYVFGMGLGIALGCLIKAGLGKRVGKRGEVTNFEQKQ